MPYENEDHTRKIGKRLRRAVLTHIGDVSDCERLCPQICKWPRPVGRVESLCCGRVVDFVRADFIVEGFAHSQVESFEELWQRFAFAANQHGQALMGIVCNGDTSHWPDHADGDLPVPDQLGDVGQG